MTRPILYTTQNGPESNTKSWGKRFGTWYLKLLKKSTLYLVLKVTWRSGY